jgi:hypothetical protein
MKYFENILVIEMKFLVDKPIHLHSNADHLVIYVASF